MGGWMQRGITRRNSGDLLTIEEEATGLRKNQAMPMSGRIPPAGVPIRGRICVDTMDNAG